ncbi:MAG: hypothetical protein ACRCW9_06460 [Cetobacterium sp.]
MNRQKIIINLMTLMFLLTLTLSYFFESTNKKVESKKESIGVEQIHD